MSEIDLHAIDINNTDKNDTKQETPMQQINEALKVCGFGWFHVQLLMTSFFAYNAGVLITNTGPYLLPIAECDLEMTLMRKGLLNAAPYVGMICSSAVSGFLIDTFGRKIFLVCGFGTMGICNVIAGFSQTYQVLLTVKIIEGVVFAAAFSATMTYASEFCHNGIRDRIMIFQSSFASTSQIILAGVSWAILMRDWHYTFLGGYVVLNTWNFYLLLMASYPLMACIMYSLLPESPKFLIGQQRFEEARKIVCYIYKRNTGQPVETFAYADLWKDKTTKAVDDQPESPKTLGKQLTAGLHNVKPLFKKPYLHILILFCCMNFSIMLLYNVIRMWFPQLSTIVEHYDTPEHQELCEMLDAYTNDLKLRSLNVTEVSKVCVPVKSGTATYINTVILGCVCLLPYMLSGLIVSKVGKKRILIVSGLLCIGLSLGLRWSKSRIQVVALFATDMAMSQVMMSLLQATVVEHFPTSVRTLAISILMMIGRIGSLFGNLIFPILLNIGCVVPFFFLAGVMACVTCMTVLVPNKKQ